MSEVNIFLAPCANAEALRNFEKTVIKGYPKSDLELDNNDQNTLEALKNIDTLYLWGNTRKNSKAWMNMKENDWVFFYKNKTIFYVARIFYKVQSEKLANQLWNPLEQDGEKFPWEYIYFLKDIRETDISYKTVAQLAGYSGAMTRRFLTYDKKGVNNILKTYGSIEAFIDNPLEIPGSTEKTSSDNIDHSIPMKYKDLLLAIKTKPFILLAGLSGTGKSHLVRTLAYQTCPKPLQKRNNGKPGNYELITVRPNWHDSAELLGYISRINGEKYIITPFLRFLIKAWKNPETPFFLCLDEMNLAPVEQYFAEYLSIIETRCNKPESGVTTDYLICKDSIGEALYTQLLEELESTHTLFSEGIGIPSNLVVIGTVNMDETTHSFSRKVLDRAMTFEVKADDLRKGLESGEDEWKYPLVPLSPDKVIGSYTLGSEVYHQYKEEAEKVIDFLIRVNQAITEPSFKIAYRVRDEFLIYCFYASKEENRPATWLQDALDKLVVMKILSRIEGDEHKVRKSLENLNQLCNSEEWKLAGAVNKINEMLSPLAFCSYTSFWS